MGQSKDVHYNTLAQKYFSHWGEFNVYPKIDQEYLQQFDNFIIISCLSLTIKLKNKINAAHIAKKLLFIEENGSIEFNQENKILYNHLSTILANKLSIKQFPQLNKRYFKFMAIEMVIFCQSIDKSKESQLYDLITFLIDLLTLNSNYTKYTDYQKTLYRILKKEYSYYEKRGLKNLTI